MASRPSRLGFGMLAAECVVLVFGAGCSTTSPVSSSGPASSSDERTSSSGPARSSDERTSSSRATDEASSSGQTADYDPCAELDDLPAGASLFEPADLPNLPLDGPDGALSVYSWTLKGGPAGLELYAGICHKGEGTLCSVALQVEFYDQADQLIGSASGAVQSGRLFEFSQSPYPISCVVPGQTAMAALTSLPEGMALADVKSMGYRFPAFLIDDAVPLPGARVTSVEALSTAAGALFRGTLTNDSDSAISSPSVSVFPLNEVGRPLGNAVGAEALEIAPGGTWEFETNVVAGDGGAHQIAFATASFVSPP